MTSNKCLQILWILLFFAATGAIAQERDLAIVNYTFSRLKYNDTAASARQLDVRVRMPLYQKGAYMFGATLAYKHVSFNGMPESYASPLQGLVMQGAFLYRLTPRRSLTFFAQAGLFSDMKDISAKDFRYSAGFRYRVRHSEKLSTGWGLAYSRQFFGNQVIPFIDVDYRPNDKWTITGQFPIKPKVLYNVNSKLSAGLELNGEAASYRLSSAQRSDQFIQTNQWTGLTKLEYQFSKYWQLNFGIGSNFKQSYKLYDDASITPWTIITLPIGDKAAPVQKIEHPGMNIQAGIAFKPF